MDVHAEGLGDGEQHGVPMTALCRTIRAQPPLVKAHALRGDL